MDKSIRKYKLYIELEREGSVLKINDVVSEPFYLQEYIFMHDLEAYTIINFKLEEIKE